MVFEGRHAKLRDLILGQRDPRAVPHDLRIKVRIPLPHLAFGQGSGARICNGLQRSKLLLHRRQIGHLRRGDVPPRIGFMVERGDLFRAFGRAGHYSAPSTSRPIHTIGWREKRFSICLAV